MDSRQEKFVHIWFSTSSVTDISTGASLIAWLIKNGKNDLITMGRPFILERSLS